MGTITVVISDELEEEIRRIISRGGKARKGALSELVENALRMYIEALKRRSITFKAIKEGRVIAEADSLDELAAKLREAGLDPRGVRIISHPPPKLRRRMGLRCRRV